MEDLTQLRKKINEVDEQILKSLEERVQICKSIGATKRKMRRPVKDSNRENEVYDRVMKKAVAFGLDPIKVGAIFREIVNMCCSVQE